MFNIKPAKTSYDSYVKKTSKSIGDISEDVREEISNAIEKIIKKAQPAIDSTSDQVNEVIEHSYDVARKKINQVQRTLEHTSDNITSRIQEKPIQSVLIAAGVGALVISILSALTHSSYKNR